MWVIDTEAAEPRLRGLLSRWAVEVRAGLYVGSTTTKIRDQIWDQVRIELGADGNAVLLFPAPQSPAGFEVKSLGTNRRVPLDVDGVLLMAFIAPVALDAVPAIPDSGPEAGYLEVP